MFLSLLLLSPAHAQSALTNNGVILTAVSSSGGSPYVIPDCRTSPGANTGSTTVVYQPSGVEWFHDTAVAGIRDFESEMLIQVSLGAFQLGNVVSANEITVEVSDASGPVRVYDYANRTWTTTPVVIATGYSNETRNVYVRPGRHVDFDSLAVTVTGSATVTCNGTDVFDQGYAWAFANFVSFGAW